MPARGDKRISGRPRVKRIFKVNRRYAFKEDDLTGFALLKEDAQVQFGLLKSRRDRGAWDDEDVFQG